MKQIIHIICLLIITLGCQAQTNIDGIGIFRIGTPINEIFSKAKEGRFFLKDVNSLLDIQRAAYNIQKTNCPEVKQYFILQCFIANVSVNQIVLSFYNDMLYKVQSGNPNQELENAISVSYGQPIVNNEKRIVACRYKLTGVEYSEEATIKTITWRNDSEILCNKICSKNFDDKCQTVYNSNFIIENRSISDIISKCDLEFILNKMKEDEIKKNEKYKGFK